MHNEIERKFLVQKMPKLRGITPVLQERYFIQSGDLVEEGFKRKGRVFEHELKIAITPDERTREVVVITKDEFEKFKPKNGHIIYRDSYPISKKPLLSIKKYKGDYEGLVLAEVEFDSHEEAEKWRPLKWMGAEVTDTPLGKDSSLILLSRKKFKGILGDIEERFNFKNIEGEAS
ncbi:MAG: hypothetical protein QG653_4 [Patescibacteria group bacterium]|nr:hypothetical protein [Patescibacteria group bacterium]